MQRPATGHRSGRRVYRCRKCGGPMNRIRVIIVDDHALFRRGLAEFLSEEEDLEVVGQAANGAEAIQKAMRSSAPV
ncbi:MAG: hypothetical protein AAB281_01955, partial [Actinomycetota bacterium]